DAATAARRRLSASPPGWKPRSDRAGDSAAALQCACVEAGRPTQGSVPGILRAGVSRPGRGAGGTRNRSARRRRPGPRPRPGTPGGVPPPGSVAPAASAHTGRPTGLPPGPGRRVPGPGQGPWAETARPSASGPERLRPEAGCREGARAPQNPGSESLRFTLVVPDPAPGPHAPARAGSGCGRYWAAASEPHRFGTTTIPPPARRGSGGPEGIIGPGTSV